MFAEIARRAVSLHPRAPLRVRRYVSYHHPRCERMPPSRRIRARSAHSSRTVRRVIRWTRSSPANCLHHGCPIVPAGRAATERDATSATPSGTSSSRRALTRCAWSTSLPGQASARPPSTGTGPPSRRSRTRCSWSWRHRSWPCPDVGDTRAELLATVLAPMRAMTETDVRTRHPGAALGDRAGPGAGRSLPGLRRAGPSR